MSIILKIHLVKSNQLRAFKFAPLMDVSEACALIQEKTQEGGEHYGLFQCAAGERSARWLKPHQSLEYHQLKTNDTLEFKTKSRPQKFKLFDDTIKTIIVDESLQVEQVIEVICKKLSLRKVPENMRLQLENSQGYLNRLQSLHEQGVTGDMMLEVRMPCICEDSNISRDDPVQMHLQYVQARNEIVAGTLPCRYDEAVLFAALQCQLQFGYFNPSVHKPGFIKSKSEFLLACHQNKRAEKDIIEEYRKLTGMSEINAKYRYIQLCRSLKAYGITWFPVKIGLKKALVPRLLGIASDAIMIMNNETKEVVSEYRLTQLKRWAATPTSFVFDFGDYAPEHLICNTVEGGSISQLVGSYIDIVLRRRVEDDPSIGTIHA